MSPCRHGDALLDEAQQLQERYRCWLSVRSIRSGAAVNRCPLGHLVLVTLDFDTLEEANRALHYARTCLLPVVRWW
jgi:hypothetical protein